MSGIAFVLSGCDFSAKNLGQVTFLEDADITGLNITGNDIVSGVTSVYGVTYLPLNTTQRGVVWSIISGSQYATIDTNTGVLTVLSGASLSAVTIKATSTIDNSITSTKSITVTYVEVPILLQSLTISGSDSIDGAIDGNTSQYTANYDPSNTTQIGITWGLYSDSTCTNALSASIANIDSSGKVTLISALSSSLTIYIKAVSSSNTSIYTTKTLNLATHKTIQITIPTVKNLIYTTTGSGTYDGWGSTPQYSVAGYSSLYFKLLGYNQNNVNVSAVTVFDANNNILSRNGMDKITSVPATCTGEEYEKTINLPSNASYIIVAAAYTRNGNDHYLAIDSTIKALPNTQIITLS